MAKRKPGPKKRAVKLKTPKAKAALVSVTSAAAAFAEATVLKAEVADRARDNNEILTRENIRRRQIIRRTLRDRIIAHQRVIGATRALAALKAAGPRPLNILAQGDSWFDYPVSNADIIDQLPAMLDPKPEILNLAHHGEMATTLLGVERRNELLDALRDGKNGAFDAIVFSGGGNDLAGDQFRLWLRNADDVGHDPTKAIDTKAYEAILTVVMTGYRDLVATRDLVDKTMPIFVHAYDFAWPTNIDVCGVVGPWIFPSLESRGWMTQPGEPDLSIGAGIVKAMLKIFKARLEAEFANVHVISVPTQGVLGLAQWANEMHPTREGFRWVTRQFAKTIAAAFPNRVKTVGF